jgi:hypothetical protein
VPKQKGDLKAAKATCCGNLAADAEKRRDSVPGGKVTMTLNAEQRRGLALLANADGNGATQQLLAAHGFGVPIVAGLVSQGSRP